MSVVVVLAIALVGLVVQAFPVDYGSDVGCDYNSAGVRPLYFSNCSFQQEWLSELPEMPSDFTGIMNVFKYGFVGFRDQILNESYWLQPEWFPNFDSSVDAILDTGSDRVAVWCVGVYPADFYVKVSPGANFTVYTWVKNLAIQSKYEGVGLRVDYPESAVMRAKPTVLSFNSVEQDAVYARENIAVDFSPDSFVLSPAYPVITRGWVEMIRVDVNVSSSISPGRYVVGFSTVGPDKDLSESMRLKHKFFYTDPIGGEFACHPRTYRLYVEVE